LLFYIKINFIEFPPLVQILLRTIFSLFLKIQIQRYNNTIMFSSRTTRPSSFPSPISSPYSILHLITVVFIMTMTTCGVTFYFQCESTGWRNKGITYSTYSADAIIITHENITNRNTITKNNNILNQSSSPKQQQQQSKVKKQSIIYILDSGIMTSHLLLDKVHIETITVDIEQPPITQTTTSDPIIFDSTTAAAAATPPTNTDISHDSGHGTYVASIVSRTVNTSSTTLVNVKILRGGIGVSGTLKNLQRGMEAAVRHYQQHHDENKLPIMLLSLSVDVPGVLNELYDFYALKLFRQTIKWVSDSGFILVAAAGNSNQDACTMELPRSAVQFHSNLLVVGSITVPFCASRFHENISSPMSRASFSNFGACINIWAPGVRIYGAGIGSEQQIIENDGTSASAALIAGIVSTFWLNHPQYLPQQIVNIFTSLSRGIFQSEFITAQQSSSSFREVDYDGSKQLNNRMLFKGMSTNGKLTEGKNWIWTKIDIQCTEHSGISRMACRTSPQWGISHESEC
jgi:hypothetical protein